MILSGQDIDGIDWTLPDPVSGYGNGTNAITSSTYAVLPTNTCSCSITNPHPSATLLVMVDFGCRMIVGAQPNEVRAAISVTGSLTAPAGLSGAGPVGWGEILRSMDQWGTQHRTVVTYELPPSGTAATFAVWAQRYAGAGTARCDYPTLLVTPLRYLVR